MIFLLWMVFAEPSELPISDQKVIRYILEQETTQATAEGVPVNPVNPANPVAPDSEAVLTERLLSSDDTREREIQQNDPAYLSWWWVLIVLAILGGGANMN